jgi:hypothetical protein
MNRDVSQNKTSLQIAAGFISAAFLFDRKKEQKWGNSVLNGSS